MLRYRNTIVVSQIVNLTGSPFNMYEECSGKILTLIPSVEKLPMKVNFVNGIEPSTYYVVSKDKINSLRKKRTLEDIAFICDEGDGYAKIHICSLALADNPKIRIKLYRNKITVSTTRLPQSQLYVELT